MAGMGKPQEQAPAPAGGEEDYTSPTSMFDEGSVDTEEPTPEEQAQFEAFERAVMEIIFPKGGKVNADVLDNLKGGFDPSALEMFAEAQPALTDSPQDSLAATAVLLTLVVEQGSEEQFTDDVVLHGGKRVIEELIEVAEAAKIHDFSERDIETVTYRAVDLYRISSPRVDPEALKAEFGALAQASEQGNLGAVLPGLPGGQPMQQGAQ